MMRRGKKFRKANLTGDGGGLSHDLEAASPEAMTQFILGEG